MEEIRISDSYDNDVPMLASLSQSIKCSLKPKFISNLQKTQKYDIPTFHDLKKVSSREILKTVDDLQSQSIHSKNLVKSLQNDALKGLEFKSNLQTIKQTTIYEDKSVNVISLFEHAERLSNIYHQNKRTLRFLETSKISCSKFLMQRTQWAYFSSYEGNGILILPDGRIIKGFWSNGTPVNKVMMTYPNKSVYYGQLNENLQKHGDGFIYFKNGQKLQAKFFMGKMHGSGLYYDKKGQVKKNIKFKNGLLMSSKKA